MQPVEHLIHGLGARAVKPHNTIARIVSETVAFSKNCVAPHAIDASVRAGPPRCVPGPRVFVVRCSHLHGSGIVFSHEPAGVNTAVLTSSWHHTSYANAWLVLPLVVSYLHTIIIFRSIYCTIALSVRSDLP